MEHGDVFSIVLQDLLRLRRRLLSYDHAERYPRPHTQLVSIDCSFNWIILSRTSSAQPLPLYRQGLLRTLDRDVAPEAFIAACST